MLSCRVQYQGGKTEGEREVTGGCRVGNVIQCVTELAMTSWSFDRSVGHLQTGHCYLSITGSLPLAIEGKCIYLLISFYLLSLIGQILPHFTLILL